MYARGHPPSAGCCVVGARASVDGGITCAAAPTAESDALVGISRLTAKTRLKKTVMILLLILKASKACRCNSYTFPHVNHRRARVKTSVLVHNMSSPRQLAGDEFRRATEGRVSF